MGGRRIREEEGEDGQGRMGRGRREEGVGGKMCMICFCKTAL